MSRCTGHCCRRFSMSASPEIIRVSTDPDAAMVSDMLIQLPEGGPWYTCRHYDTESGDCRVYDNRPAMCRRYGTSQNSCEHGGCTKADRSEVVQLANRSVIV